MEMEKEPLPEVELYSIGPDEADYAAPLLTDEAVEEIKAGMAFGMALVEEGEVRATVCARLFPENVVLEIPTIADSSARLVQRLLSDSTATHMRRTTLDLTGTEAA